MLGSCEKMVVISPTTNEWPQVNHRFMEKPIEGQDHHHQPQQQQQPPLPPPPPSQQPLKCPRCDSSNTKFCYYNNYSLSQPRHFCKACKRYWTRGGTLRNVPVGGGCRKNKRIKRPSAPSVSSSPTPHHHDHHIPTSSSSPSLAPNLQAQIDHINPLIYGLPTNNNPFSRLFSSRVSSFEGSISGFHDNNNNNHIGLGFSPHGILGGENTSSSHLSCYPMFGSSSSFSSSSLSSLIASSLNGGGNNNGFHGLLSPYGEMQVRGGNLASKEVKMEVDGQNMNRLMSNWNNNINGGVSSSHYQIMNQMGQSNNTSASDNNNPSSLSWNNGVGSWFDPSNMGSSVSSLI